MLDTHTRCCTSYTDIIKHTLLVVMMMCYFILESMQRPSEQQLVGQRGQLQTRSSNSDPVLSHWSEFDTCVVGRNVSLSGVLVMQSSVPPPRGQEFKQCNLLMKCDAQQTFLVGPHQAGLLVLLAAGPARVAGNQVHVGAAVQQELHQTDVSMEAGAVQG